MPRDPSLFERTYRGWIGLRYIDFNTEHPVFQWDDAAGEGSHRRQASSSVIAPLTVSCRTRNLDGVSGQENQSDSNHDYSPTHYNSKRYDCGVYNDRCSDKRGRPDNGPDDTKTHPDYDFHFRFVFKRGQMLTTLSMIARRFS